MLLVKIDLHIPIGRKFKTKINDFSDKRVFGLPYDVAVVVRTFQKLLELGMDLDKELEEDTARMEKIRWRRYADPVKIYADSIKELKGHADQFFSKIDPKGISNDANCNDRNREPYSERPPAAVESLLDRHGNETCGDIE